MLPFVVIGADERTEQVIRAHDEIIARFYPNTEYATFDLNDQLGDALIVANSGGRTAGVIEFDGQRNAWRCNVAYGPDALVRAATAMPTRLAHTGWTLALVWEMPDRTAPRRVVEGRPSGADVSTVALQAPQMVGANFLVDLSVAPTLNGRSTGLAVVIGQMRAKVEP